MNVTIADSAGFCFGVKRAVDAVYELLDADTASVMTYGPIIHNETVTDELASKGVKIADDIENIPKDATLVIRSHGVGREIIEKLEKNGINYVDATCPFVKKIHQTVSEHSAAGEEIVIIGSAQHPEVKGILGWVSGKATVIENEAEATDFTPFSKDNPVCIVAQTTFNLKKFQDLVEIFQKKGYYINIVNTVCHATMTRQEEAELLAEQSDAMIVIGGRESSNSRKLYEICKNKCLDTFFIQTADELKDIDLSKFASLGITAGASTPNNIIQEVSKACQR
ncbi:MAG: 4-hydroxy-3-methylbut-2-enyl diphosphate reductase [Eubacterium sp.]|nr:4-hydroxy-3-methylbut-2-enyl diphosphate reductase [Eubacterium sp.]